MAAYIRRSKLARLNRKMQGKAYRFRLGAILALDNNPGQYWP